MIPYLPQTPIEHFTAFVIERLRRSGVTVDETYHFVLDTEYPVTRKLTIKPIHTDSRYIVCGDEKTFWVFETDQVWPDTPTANPFKPRILPVQFRPSKPTPRGGFYDIDHDIVPNDCYTPIEPGYYTAYECDIWLAEHRGVLV